MNFSYYAAPCVIVIGCLFYHLSIKSLPEKINPFFTFFVVYLIAAAISFIAMLLFGEGEKGIAVIKKNHAIIAMGILCIEVGFLLAYRLGWNLGYTAISVNVMSTLVLIPIGVIFFHEEFSWQKASGVGICILGLFLMMKR